MRVPTQVAVEAHPHSATLYLSGRVSVAALIGALRRDPTVTRSRSLRYAVDAPFHTPT